MTFKFKDAFISYGRRESLNFVARLHQQLKRAGYDIWFDKVNIPDGDDYALRIDHGIESAHNFIYIMAPRCLTSPYCLLELEYARWLGKRIIPINQRVIYNTNSQPLSDSNQQMMKTFYQSFDLPNQNLRTTQDVLNRSHALLGKTDWLDAKEKVSDEDCKAITQWARPYENHWAKHEQIDYLNKLELPVFGQPIDAMPGVVERVTAVLEREKNYVQQHTQILAEALHWQRHQKTTQHLLVSPERTAAEQWLLTEFTPPDQPPCQSSALVCEFICEARKNAENLMTDIFICASTADQTIRNQLLESLSHYAKTVWTHDRDIQKGTDYQQAIKIGIENADNFIFFISPDSVASEHCQRELAYALQYNKRIIPLLIVSIPDSEIPEVLRGLQYLDFTEHHRETGLDEILAILQSDHEYYEWHKVLLARALKWTAEDHKTAFLLRGHNLEKAKTWLRHNDKREQHAPLPLHKALITASDTAGQSGTEVFVSYSRKDSDFARQLNAQLLKAGKTTWFDQESIDTGAEFEKTLFEGIDSADNFLFILSPAAVTSPYCEREVNYAASLGKRFITVLHRETEPNTMPMALRIIQWLDFSNPAEFETAFLALLRALEQQQAYIHQHTEILALTLHWQQNQKAAQHLLIGEQRMAAEEWLLTEFLPPNQPPCQPTPLMCEFICEARKNAENRMTDVFICYDEQDKDIRNAVVQSLSRHVKTCWQHDREIQKAERYEYAIEQGIEGADNVLFFMSPSSVVSDYCQYELTHALKYHKRIIPLLITPTPTSDIPEAQRGLQYIDFTTDPANYNSKIDKILNILTQDQEYYKQHKLWLVRSRKWAAENRKSMFLLQGHNLEMAKAWLRLSEKRQQHPPLPLHHELITASETATRQVGTELFISYSRKDNDFVRKLNTKLQEAGKTVWYDQETQASSLNASGVDFEQETFKGIDNADNFIFVVSPPSVASRYCGNEINHAASRGKRIIAVLYREIDPNTMPAALPAVQGLEFSNRAEFEAAFLELVRTLERQKTYLHQHTEILAHALHWQQHQKAAQHLLVGEERLAAEEWLLTEFRPPNQPPCQPTPLICEFICEARKNAENRMTDIFICYDVQDKALRDSVVQSLSRYAKTCWMHDRDIHKGEQYDYAIEQGIEGADNVLFFISPSSVVSEYCQHELAHAVKYHKRIVPLLITPTPTSDIPEALRGLQYIDFTDNTPADSDSKMDEILNILTLDQEYYKQHKLWLVRSRKWAAENRKPMFLLRGHNLETAKAWLRLSEKRQQHLPLPLHQELITASETATRQVGTELFISYSRKDNDFVQKLNTRLTEAGKTVWFDQETQTSGINASCVDFETETFKGIDNADNFLSVVSPPSVASRYCVAEINHAASRGKRIITVWHREIDPNTMPAALQDTQRLDFSNRAEFEATFLALVRTLEREKTYLHQHTEILAQALHWQQHQKATQYLLVGEERTVAEQWLLTEFLPPNQPPCQPTPLMCDFICEARKNAENLMTDIFICYDEHDKDIRHSVVQSLSRHAKTCWTPVPESRKGLDYECAIEQGIEGADNFFFFISPASVASYACRQELAHALKYHKRIVPLLITPTPISALPDALRSLQNIDFTDNTCQADYDSDINDILNILKQDQDYHKQHKVLLVRALKWSDENQKPSFLLRGHNLENAKTWLRLSEKRQQHRPLELHQQLITASEAAKGQLGTEVFLSYSRKDSDFARHLNTQLQEAGKTTFFDQESISTGVDFEKEIFKGIDGADNFVFVVSPDAVESEYCEREVNYAADNSKRFISVLHRETDPTTMPEALRKINWIDFKNITFDKSFPELIQAIELDREHAHQHTLLQQRAYEWVENNRNPDFLLNHTACANAERWRDNAQEVNKQPAPTQLQQEFILNSREAIEAAASAERRLRNSILEQKKQAEESELRAKKSEQEARQAQAEAVAQKEKAEKQKNDALRNQSFALSALSQIEIDKGNTTNAILLALEGLPKKFPVHERPYVAEAEDKLHKAVVNHTTSYAERFVMEGDDSVYHVAFSPDGKTLAAAAGTNVQLFNATSGQLLQTLIGHTSTVYSVAFSPDGSLLVTAGRDKTARLWQVPSGKPVQTLAGHTWIVNHAAFSPDGSLLVTASSDNTARLWQVPSGKPVKTLAGHQSMVNHAAFSPDGSLLVTASSDKTARLWQVPSGKPVKTLAGHTNTVRHAAFSPDGSLLVTASYDNTARLLWQVPSGKPVKTLAGHTRMVNHAAFSPDGSLLVTASDDNTARLWQVPSGKPVKTLAGHTNWVRHAAFSPDGSLLVTASRDNTARLWQVPSGKPVKTLAGHQHWVNHAAFSPDGSLLVTASSDKTARLWLASTQALIDYANERVPRCLTPKQRQDFFLSELPAAWNLIEKGEQLAKTGQISEAVAQFQRAQQQAPCLKFDPTDKAQKLAAQAQIAIGKALLTDGKRDDAIAAFNSAIQIDSRFNGLPLVANHYIEEGNKLAKKGKITVAVAEFSQAKKLVPSFIFEQETEAKQVYAVVFIEQGQKLAEQGKIDAAIAKYQKAQQMDASLEISAKQWDSLCWYGSLSRQAAKVMKYCEKAVALEPEYKWWRRSRGLARALVGDTQGAIEDFQFFVKRTEWWQSAQTQGWINILKKGENPFTEEVLKRLR
jgi:WD40 repeat protein